MYDNLKHSILSKKIIGAFYNVYNTLGCGFLEKVYEKALLVELRNVGLSAYSQKPIEVYYCGEHVGSYFADIVVEDLIILELKTGDSLSLEYEAQLVNYLRATDIEVGLLLGFCNKPSVKRRVFTNEQKEDHS